MDYSNAAAAAVLQSIGTPEAETESSAVAALESALQQNRPPVMHGLNPSMTVTNNKRNGTEVLLLSQMLKSHTNPFLSESKSLCR